MGTKSTLMIFMRKTVAVFIRVVFIRLCRFRGKEDIQYREVMAAHHGVESALHARDRIGVQDFVLLEDYRSMDAFTANLQKRFKANHIYVSVQLAGPQD